jgi:hypothetical protein
MKKRNAEDHQVRTVLLEVPTDSDLPARIEKISEQTGLSPLNLFQKWVLQEESLIGVLQSNKERLSDQTEACPDVSLEKIPAAREEDTEADAPAPNGPDDRKRLLKRAIKLRKEGMTLKRIAETFNEEKVPTMSGTGKWYASSVTNLLSSRV